jgi:DNA-directed RNA polymerase subunit RPC12/RpoP
MSLTEKNCSNCGKRISIAEDGFGQGRCIMCNLKVI